MEMCREQSVEFMFFGFKGYSIGDQQLTWFLTTQLRHKGTRFYFINHVTKGNISMEEVWPSGQSAGPAIWQSQVLVLLLPLAWFALQ